MIITPNYIENKKNTKIVTDPFSRLLESRIILLFNEINDDVAASIISQLLLLEAFNYEKEIELYINSPGGSVTAGFAILDVMTKIKCPISTVAVGACSSMAAILLAGGTKGKRYALPHSEIMIHQPLGGTQGQATDILIHANRIKQCREKINKLMSEFTGQSLKTIAQDMERDHFLSAKEALDYGIIDAII